MRICSPRRSVIVIEFNVYESLRVATRGTRKRERRRILYINERLDTAGLKFCVAKRLWSYAFIRDTNKSSQRYVDAVIWFVDGAGICVNLTMN